MIDMEPGSRRQRRFYNPAIIELAGLDKPVIAAVNGATVGAGLSLAAAADIRVASERARFKCGFVDVGLAPDTGTSLFLERMLGYSRAFYFLATGHVLSASEALSAGLVNEVVPHDSLLDRAGELAALLAAKPGIGVAATKGLLRHAATASLADQLEAESTAYDRTSVHPERLAARASLASTLRGDR
jgi:2-(1,2-epoxy-1,2-dihydrophenyl)acetyl-CoA isomerase